MGEKRKFKKGKICETQICPCTCCVNFFCRCSFCFAFCLTPKKRFAQKHANRQLFYLLTCFLSFLFPFSNFILLVFLDFADMFGFPCFFFHFFSFLFPTLVIVGISGGLVNIRVANFMKCRVHRSSHIISQNTK